MLTDHPFFIDDLDSLRRSVLALETQTGKKAQLWRLLKNSARSAPLNFPWFTPFVALITREERDIENARMVLRTYLSKLDAMSFGIGMQFHFWCFAFPHAKWSLYFQWLCTLGAFDEAEQERIRRALVTYHFINFYYGLRTKPEPECVDNQTLSLAFSNALVGYLFSQGSGASEMARRMLRDGLRRLPVVIGDMPASGYSGEGSSYMDCVNGPAIPLAVELLEHITGERGLLTRPLGGGQGTPLAVLRMVAREWMPGGLLLPWDNYGYQHGVRAALAYAARKTGEKLFSDILEQDAVWSYDIGTGWAYDDLVWALIWWPDAAPSGTGGAGRSWFEPEVGGALVSPGQDFYLAQLWDASAPGIPTRMHVNPNAVLFNAYRVPLSADGAAPPGGSARFAFSDTTRSVSFLTMGGSDTYNYGDGCGGAHSIILVDGWEGLRVFGEGAQFKRPEAGAGLSSLSCDVSPVYAERFPDVLEVRRRSSLACERLFVVEDLARFSQPHEVTSRFLLRPGFTPVEQGVKIVTPEGVSLHLLELLGGDTIRTEAVTDFPLKPDGRCGMVDFSRRGAEVRRLFIGLASRIFAPAATVKGFTALPDDARSLGYAEAREGLARSDIRSDLLLPPHMETGAPIARRWWFQARVEKRPGRAWLLLPLGLADPQLFIDGEPIDLARFQSSMDLIGPRVELPSRVAGAARFELVLRTDVPVSHYEGHGDGTIGLAGGVSLCYPVEEETILSAGCSHGQIRVVTNLRRYEFRYTFMEKG